MPKTFLLLLFSGCCLFSFRGRGQQLDHVQGQVIVQLNAKADVRSVIKSNRTFQGIATSINAKERLSKSLNIWLLSFDFGTVNESLFEQFLAKLPEVVAVQANYFIDPRSTIPNDVQFAQQWQYFNTGQSGGTSGFDLDMDLAWDITTGGVTPSGDTIVVCVIDNGLEFTHEDFGDNLWVNYAEIPNNGIDDDGNGYIDDYRGWNSGKDNDDISGDNWHGTPIAGIIGAKGNNGIGVAGINWDVKLMIVSAGFFGGAFTVAEVVQAYDFALVHRRKYNESNGTEGAFVVATNSSWGIARRKADAFPVWCNMYDALGEQGILSIGATDDRNINLNVDEVGDMPTTCPSDFLIAVTNVDHNGEKPDKAAFGKINIDLAAFGGDGNDGVWTTDTGNGYSNFAGTSASAPQVTGAVALLYSAPCSSLSDLTTADPAAAALKVHQYILDGVVPNPVFDTLTVTGGHLNINNSLLKLFEDCQSCLYPTSVEVDSVIDVSASLSWITNNTIERVDLRWKEEEASEWIEVQNVSSPFRLDNLTACSNYEYQLRSFCSEEALDYTDSYLFSTLGCCSPPTDLSFTVINEEFALGEWPPIFAADGYIVRYRSELDTAWMSSSTAGNNFFFGDLQTCTRYEIEIATLCENDTSAYSEHFALLTKGCGACLEAAYCLPQGIDATEEWISLVRIDTFRNVTKSDNGYGDYTHMFSGSFDQGSNYEIELAPSFAAGNSFTQFFHIWIDLDQNGSFTSNELVFSDKGGTQSPITRTLSIPQDAELGSTRLRVGMLSTSDGSACPFGATKFGEYEDYCIQITERTPTSVGGFNLAETLFQVFPNPVEENSVSVQTRFPTPIRNLFLEWVSVDGKIYDVTEIENHPANSVQTNSVDISTLSPGIYFLRLRALGRKTLVRKVVVVE